VAFRLKDHAGGDKWNNIYVVLNGNNTIQSINIPKGKYTIVANNGVINEGGNGEMEGGEITIDAQTALILHD
jgi:pullulanase, type I